MGLHSTKKKEKKKRKKKLEKRKSAAVASTGSGAGPQLKQQQCTRNKWCGARGPGRAGPVAGASRDVIVMRFMSICGDTFTGYTRSGLVYGLLVELLGLGLRLGLALGLG